MSLLWNFGKKKSKKQLKRETLAENRAKGRAAEKQFVFGQELWGNKVVRTGRGSDYRVTERNIWTGKVSSHLVEVKSGTGKLSDLQSKTKQKNRRYKIKRIEPIFY
jgi:hypothetical protein